MVAATADGKEDPPTRPSVSIEAIESLRTIWCRSSVISSVTLNLSLGLDGGKISFTDPAFAPDTRTIAPGLQPGDLGELGVDRELARRTACGGRRS